jgi:hypothetical protein
MTRKLYYRIKPLLPRAVQIILRSRLARYKRKRCSEIWPIDERAGNPPPGWKGWPDGKKFAFVLRHDVDTFKGHEKVRELAALEEGLGFRSCFYFVPERYPVSRALVAELKERGFEVGVHGLVHDGMLFSSRELFLKRAARINKYLKEWGAVGFSSPSMHHKLEWMHKIDMEYDISTFDTDPFEPQPDPARTIFPFWYQQSPSHRGFVEIPYTLAQDFTLFILLKEKDTSIWKRKLDWIADRGGLALVNTHPDYMNFDKVKCGIDEYEYNIYEEFLVNVKRSFGGSYWHTILKDISGYVRVSVRSDHKHAGLEA